MDKKELRQSMLSDFHRSGLDEEDANTLEISCEPHGLIPNAAGYIMPYFDEHGKTTKFYRVRYVENTLKGFSALTGAKPQRYAQPAGTLNEAYLPPYINWSEEFKGLEPLIITEGEKKAAAASKRNFPTIGLGGVWCFMSKKSNIALLPIFDKINLSMRTVIICFDSDAANNPNILAAESVLARRLLEKGALVKIARISLDSGKKCGIDDYLLNHSDEEFEEEVLQKSFYYAESQVLHEMNENLVYLRNIGTIHDYKHDMKLSASAFTQHAYSNQWFEVVSTNAAGVQKTVRKSAAVTWLEWEFRSELKGLTYAPGEAVITDNKELNAWKGWGVKNAVPGDVSLWHELLDKLFEQTDTEARRWFENWCAYPIQHPGVKMASAVLFWGATQGTGKSTVGYTLMRLYGENATEVKDADLEDSRFSWAENKQFVLGDDITGQNNRKLANKFKTMITQKWLHINPKYIQPYSVPDRINYFFTSNDPNAFYLDEGDRRLFIHEVVSNKLSLEFRKRYMPWMESELGMQNLFHYFLTLDLKNFDPQAEAFVTEAKREMTHISKSELGAWVAELKEDPDFIINGSTKSDIFTAEDLYVLYDAGQDKNASPNALARELKRSGFAKLQQKSGGAIYVGEKRVRLYAVRNIERWKAASVHDIAEHYKTTHGHNKVKKY